MFEIKLNGTIKARGDYPECFPSKEAVKSMLAAGYKIYVDGKLFTGREKK